VWWHAYADHFIVSLESPRLAQILSVLAIALRSNSEDNV